MNKKLLNSILKRKGITQEELAKKLGISRQALSNKLRGTASWTLTDMKTTSSFLRLTEEEVMAIFYA